MRMYDGTRDLTKKKYDGERRAHQGAPLRMRLKCCADDGESIGMRVVEVAMQNP